MKPNTLQFSGKNLDEALQEAADHFAVDKPFICYEVIQNNSKSSFLSKIFSNKVQINAWVETAKEDLQEAARKAVREAIGKNKSTTHPILEKFNNLFFHAFSVKQENYSMDFSKDVSVTLNDPFLEELLTKSDKLSIAYEHLFKRIAQKSAVEVPGRVLLNAGLSAEKREAKLIHMAKTLAQKVKKTGRSVVLSSKSNQERRIIHLALDGFEGVGTRSVGAGEKRRLVIFSNKVKGKRKPDELV